MVVIFQHEVLLVIGSDCSINIDMYDHLIVEIVESFIELEHEKNTLTLSTRNLELDFQICCLTLLVFILSAYLVNPESSGLFGLDKEQGWGIDPDNLEN